MSQELERYKTLCVAQEAEIARLKNGLDELRVWIKENEYCDDCIGDDAVDCGLLLIEINRITGE